MHIWQAKDKKFKVNLGISKYFLLIGAGIIKLQCSPGNKQGSKQGVQEAIRRPEDPNDDTESPYITYPCTKQVIVFNIFALLHSSLHLPNAATNNYLDSGLVANYILE